MLMPCPMAPSITRRSSVDSMPLRGATPRIKNSGAEPWRRTASARSDTTGIELGSPPRRTPESCPACRLSITETMS